MAKIDKTETQGKQTTVEEGTEFKGTMQSTCQVVVRGVIDGDLTAPTVIVSETGAVIGNVKADCIRSEGVLAGHVDANDVYLSGNVRSDTVIRAKTLEVKLQRHKEKLEVTFGECILDVGDDPAVTARDAAQAKPADMPEAQLQEVRQARPSTQPPAADAVESKAGENGKRHSVPPPPT